MLPLALAAGLVEPLAVLPLLSLEVPLAVPLEELVALPPDMLPDEVLPAPVLPPVVPAVLAGLVVPLAVLPVASLDVLRGVPVVPVLPAVPLVCAIADKASVEAASNTESLAIGPAAGPVAEKRFGLAEYLFFTVILFSGFNK